MQFNLFALVAVLLVGTAAAVPHALDAETSPVALNILQARDNYDCKGSSMCKSLQVRSCDDAVNNKLIRNDDVNYGAPG